MIQKQKKKYQILRNRQAAEKTKIVKSSMKIKKILALNMNLRKTK